MIGGRTIIYLKKNVMKIIKINKYYTHTILKNITYILNSLLINFDKYILNHTNVVIFFFNPMIKLSSIIY